MTIHTELSTELRRRIERSEAHRKGVLSNLKGLMVDTVTLRDTVSRIRSLADSTVQISFPDVDSNQPEASDPTPTISER